MILNLLLSLSAVAYVGTNVTLEGKVRSFNNQEVELISEDQVYKIPRAMILLSDLKMNQNIKVDLSEKDFKSVQKK